MKKIFLLSFLGFFFQGFFILSVFPQSDGENSGGLSIQPYLCEEDWIEVMFISESKVRLRNGTLVDLSTQALQGTNPILNALEWHHWYRFTEVPESTIDDWEVNGERNTGEDIYNLNNIYRLQIPKGKDIWKICENLEALPGIYLARPVPKPVIPPIPPSYQTNQGYLNPASNNPSGVDALYAWTQTGGTGTGVTICDLEYSWNYNHADVTKAVGSQINTNVSDPFGNTNHGTAVIGELVANNNGWGTTGISYGSNLKTCGTYYGLPSPSWNVPGAIAVAIANLNAGDIILLEQQWDYSPTGGGYYIPIEWWMNYAPSAQTNNGVYAAIVNAIANGIHVVEAGGNGSFDTGTLTWFGNSGAIIVGAGGAYSGGTWPEGNLQKLSFSSYGPRFNLQGWGENVVTTGYGDLYSAEGINYYYTSTFSGTSSASPIVAGALACAEGYYLANISATPPTPSYMRTHLVNWGTPQITPPNGNIGPRPNIQAAILNFTLSYEYGDAPDPTYPTLLASGGARHTNTGLRLGALIDIEVNGQPNATATGDDINPPGLDDEDGIWWPFNFVPGQGNTIRVTTSGSGYLNAWMDFNKNGSWADANEKIFTNQFLVAGTTDLSMVVPANALLGNTFARFRFSTQQNLGYTGLAPDGEVEDYQITIQEPELMDYGDAPNVNYKTLAVSNGARHDNIGPLVFMGNIRDLEIDGQPNSNASGDDFNPIGAMDDEDGVVFNTPMNPGQIATVTITVNMMGGFQQGWIDFNADGDFTDPGEQIISNINPPAPISPYNFNVPAGAMLGTTYARFRYATMPNIPSFGPVPNGEVEDYLIIIGEYDFGDAPDPLYPTLLISNGAYHKKIPPFMGVSIDPEPDGQPDPSASGDDNNPFGFDDEDGVWWACNFVPGHANTVKVTVTGAGFLNAWFDFNIDNDWADQNEQIFTNVPFLVAGTYDLTVNVPLNVSFGTTFMRYRFSTQQNLTYTGLAPDGEVEDYMVFIQEPEMMDYGDAPDLNYQTLAANNGARHAIQPPPGVFMGFLVDYEIDGQPDPFAKGDDNNPPGANTDEDGVVFNTPLMPGAPAQVTITVSVTGGAIQGWIDFNADGDFLDATEQIITNFAAFNFVNVINFNVPAGAVVGNTFARYRYSTMGNLAPYGCAPNGEVEDYQVFIGAITGDIPVDPDPGGLYTQNEISMALLPGTQPGIPNVILAAYNDEPYPGGPGLGIATSNDGGATWNNTHLSYPPDPYGGGFFVDQFDPTATADANGNLIVGHISTDYDWINGPASGLYVEISSDGGVTWSGPIAVATDGPPVGNPDPNYRFNDRCQITADINPGSLYYNNLYIVEIKDRGWNSPAPWGDIYFSTSTDGGLTWSPQVILNGLQSNMANMPVPAVAPDGTVYVCWMDYNVQTGGIGTIYLDISSDGGATWLASDILVRSVNLPPLRLNGNTDVLAKGAAVICASPFNSQEIYITYAEQNMLAMDEADIYFIKSTDGGLTWSNPIRVNDDFTVNDQVLPWMDVKHNGIIDIAWYDRRNDAADLQWDVYITMSTDGGNSFGANQKITDISSSTPNTPSGLWMGEYLGLVTDNTHAYLAFCQALTDVKGDIYFDKIQNPATHEIDYGDAMDPNYPTLLVNDGARHIIDGITFLGASIDPDGDGQPDPNALGDDNDEADDEDGVSFDWPLSPGNPCKLTLAASVNGGFLNGWLDFNGNGSWADPGEQVFTDLPLLAGFNDLNFTVPLNAIVGWTFARFRFSTQPGLTYTGLASDGEVEDYYVEITENPDFKWFQNPDVTLPGLHAHDAIIPPYQSIVLADDWQCNGGLVTDIHWWGNYELDPLGLERRGSGINYFHISIHQDDPSGTCLPLEPEVAGYNVSFSSLVEQTTGLINNEGCTIYLYEFILPQSFNQELGARYWVDISAFANDANNPALWRWQESRRSYYPILCGAANKSNPNPGTWSTIQWGSAPPYRYSDMAFIITSEEVVEELDFGDAPDPFWPTLLVSNGARHLIETGFFLGAGVDTEINGQPQGFALGDDKIGIDDEDGVAFKTALIPGQPASLEVTLSDPTGLGGFLDCWIDFNINGVFEQPGEHLCGGVGCGLVAGTNTINFNVPAGALVGPVTFARFRLSRAGGLLPTGQSPDGEVEDYRVFIVNPGESKMHWVQLPDKNPTGVDVDMFWVASADDFLCTETGPINEIEMWGSFADDGLPSAGISSLTFKITIYSDNPAGTVQPWSMPKDPLWTDTVYPGEYTAQLDFLGPEWWYDPDTYSWQAGNHNMAFRYNFFFDNPFIQQLDSIYWLEIIDLPRPPSGNKDYTFGWKTSKIDLRWNDDACVNIINPGVGTPWIVGWNDLRYPPTHQWQHSSLDLAFAVKSESNIDFGDLPDPNYPTLLSSNGPSHIIGPLFLGNQIDGEMDGQPNSAALGDDNNNLDDEDGIAFIGGIFPGYSSYVSVTVSMGTGLLQGWIDYNADGDFNDTGEQIFTNLALPVGTNILAFVADPNATLGTTFARFRLSTVLNLGYTGPALDGEVEDYELIIRHPVAIWHLDENAGNIAYDATNYDNDAALTGPTWTPGYSNSALNFNGSSDYALAQHSPSLDITNPFSVQAWIRCSGTLHYYAIVDKLENTPTGSKGFTMYLTGGQLRLSVYSGAAGDGDVFGTTDLRDNVFHHVFASWDGSFMRAYVDGILEGEVAWANASVSTTQNIGIGMRLSGWGGYMPFDGIIDEVIISSDAPAEMDFGDASDPAYPTLYVSNGACHIIDGVTFLGLGVDEDINGQPHPNALGDDNDESDDEDGVTVIFPLTPGGTAGIDVSASVAGNLNGWMDFNANGFWGDPGEQVFIDQALFAGSNWLFFPVPPNSVVGQTYARFRFSTVAGLSYTGLAPDGEVEDHEIMIEGELDFGDAPDIPYPTLLVNNGARHLVVPGIYLGTIIDAELNGLQDPLAQGDDNNNLDDEDGIFLPVLIAKGQMNTMTVTASVNGILNGWIDFNMDGFWGSDLTEQIFTNQVITAGNNILTFNAPATAGTGTTFARFRFSTIGGLSFTGYAPDGEVEDYQVEIGEPYKWSQQPDISPNGMDVDATADMGMMMPPCVLADDFRCDRTGPLTKINVWGSWKNDYIPEGPWAVMFILTIHGDIPADQSPTGYSMPGNILWNYMFFPGQFMVMPYAMGLMEGWYSPQQGFYTPFGDTQCWLYTFDLTQIEPFVQHGNPDEPVVYWLSVQAIPQNPDPNVRFGWKTSVNHWNDKAVWSLNYAPSMGPWTELYHPMTMEPLDLAFEIYGLESPYILTDLNVMLEGPYNGTTMNNDLNTAGLIPLAQPYGTDPLAKWYYTGTEKVPVIPNASIVDWILIELRDAPSAPLATGLTRVAQRAAFVLDDGSLVATDGSSLMKFYVTFNFNPFVVIWHRNHLGVLSANPMTPVGPGVYSYDFSTGVGQAYGGASGHKNLGSGIYGMFGGDGVPNGLINNPDKTSVWTPNVGTSGYKAGDYNLDTQVNNPDKNDIWVPNLGQGTQVPN